MDISSIDKNFAVPVQIERDGLCFYDVLDAPFCVEGVRFEDGQFRRLPQELARSVSEGVYRLHTNTAGGKVRFVTDSGTVAVYVELADCGKMPHFPFTGSIGMDIYAGERYLRTFCPPFDVQDRYESSMHTHCTQLQEYTINLPLYSSVKKLYVGLEEGSKLLAPAPYAVEKPVVFYGSSITQGGCASRPGNAYTSIVCRKLGVDHVNLGFSGNAKGEVEMAEYIAGLSMSAFVYDYDHNAPGRTHLAATHEAMFKRIRAAQPELPVLMLTRPQPYLTEEEKDRLAIVRRTYENAVAAGDRNVYFIPGPELISDLVRDAALVDNCHPGDAGFVSMAARVEPVLRQMLKIK